MTPRPFVFTFLLFLQSFAIAEVPDLESFEQNSSVWVGTEAFAINYKEHKEFHTAQRVQLIFTAKNNSWVEEGTAIAILNHKKLELEERSIRLEEEKAVLTKTNLNIQLNEASLSTRKQIDEFEQQIQLLTRTNQESELPQRLRIKAKELLETLVSQKEILQNNLDQDLLGTKLRLDLEELELSLLNKKQNYEILLYNSTIRAPFDGVIEYNEEIYEEDTSLWIMENTLYATIYNNKEVQLSCVPVSERIQSISPSNLQVEFDLDGVTYQSQYVRSERTQDARRTRTSWIFHPTSQSTEMAELTGTTRLSHLYHHFKEQHYIVPKEQIALLLPDALEKGGWKGLVAELWPQAKLTYIAPKSLVISK